MLHVILSRASDGAPFPRAAVRTTRITRAIHFIMDTHLGEEDRGHPFLPGASLSPAVGRPPATAILLAVVPGLFVFGLVLVPVGLAWQRRKGAAAGEVEAAVQASNSNATGGYLNQGANEMLVRSLGRIQSTADLESVVVKTSGGRPVVLGQVARVAEAASFSACRLMSSE